MAVYATTNKRVDTTELPPSNTTTPEFRSIEKHLLVFFRKSLELIIV